MGAPEETRDRRLAAWLFERGVEGARRVVRENDDEILVSKFEPGFAARLGEVMAALPRLTDRTIVARAYEREAARTPEAARVEVWRRAMAALVAEGLAAAGRDVGEGALVRAGIDSVAAVLDSVLWTAPAATQPWSPSAAERRAFEEALARTAATDLFTRRYGAFEGQAVVNHCPGAAYARALLACGWHACTGERRPA